VIEIEIRNAQRLERDLEKFAARAVPHAVRTALNKSAFEGRTIWQGELDQKMVLRNNWTKRSIQVDKATGVNLPTMQATLGSRADYMAFQEEGDTRAKKGKHGVPIPTGVASGEGRGAQPRRRVVSRANRLSSIHLGTRVGASRRQRNAITIRQAIASGRKHVFLELDRHVGLFRISGGKRKPKVDMIFDLSRNSVNIPKNPTLEPTLRRLGPRLPGMYAAAIIEQLRRHKVLGY
jgi:hypothetical protein